MRGLRTVAAGLGLALAIPLLPVDGVQTAVAAVGSDETSSRSTALSGTEFNPEMIISDQLFYDGNAMSSAQIQSFLDGKIGACLTSQCLNVAVAPVTSRAASYSADTGELVCSAIEGGNLRISELIYRVQVACGISAKVILVTLQKEQGLVTSRSPSEWALRAAMGMGCPDTAACSDAFAGLATQIISGTRQLKVYKAGRFGRQPGVQYVQYHPNAVCGGTTINVRNYATAALYNYTPYQPNAEALANMWATGDGCSSYGNRNFWAYYRTWFGSVDGAQFMVSTGEDDYIITRDGADALWAYPVSSSGGWGLKTSLGVGWAGVTDILGVGDLDSNGYRDLIARDMAGKVWFYPGSAVMDYPTRTQLAVDWSGQRVLSAGYIDRGKDPDILTIDATGDLWLWRGDGEGRLDPGVKVGTGFGSYPVVAGVGDLTGDACGDLVGISTSGLLMLFAGDCAGSFRAPVQIGSGFAGVVDVHAAGDFTGDGRRDLWTRDASGTMRLLRGTGGGNVASTSIVDAGWNAMKNVVGSGERPAHPPVVGSVSGTDDMFAGYLIVRDATNALWAYASNAVGGWRQPRVPLGPGWAGVTDIIGVGDLDGNGYRDVIARDTAGKSWFYPGDGGLDYPTRRQITSDWSSAKKILYGGYFDRDLFPDMLTIDGAGELWLWPGDGTGGFGPRTRIASGFGTAVSVVGVGDLDGDRCGDLVSLNSSRQLTLHAGDCNGGIRTATLIASALPTGSVDVVPAGDFTGDGLADLWVKNSDGTIRLFRGTGGGTVVSTGITDAGWGSFQNITGAGMRAGSPLPVGTPLLPPAVEDPTPPPSARQAGVGDIDGDGHRDILGVTADGRLRAYFGDGIGGIKSDAVLDAKWGIAGVLQFPMGDFNGDGRPDVGVITSAGDFLIAKGTGSGFATPSLLARNWGDFDTILSALDWDGDGKIDVVGRTRSGELWLYRGDGAGGWASLNGIRLAANWRDYRPISVGDFDGDGKGDILALQTNGDLWLYRGNGAGGWASLDGVRIGTGWNAYTDVFSPGDFDGAAGPDLLARSSDGNLYLFPGTGSGGLGARRLIDSGWQTFRAIL